MEVRKRAKSASLEPIDRYQANRLGFIYQGISTCFPWNVLISGQNFFIHKLSSLEVANDFLAHLAIIFMTVRFIFLLSAVFVMKRIRPTQQITYATAGQIIVFALITIFTVAPSISLSTYYSMLLSMVLLASIFSAFVETGFFAIIGVFPASYMQGFIFGHGIAGVIVVTLNIISYLCIGNSANEQFAIVFFGMSLLVIAVSLILILIQQKSMFFQHYLNLGADMLQEHPAQAVDPMTEPSSYLSLFKQTYDVVLALFINVIIGLILFPTFILMTKSTALGTTEETRFHHDMFGQISLLLLNFADLAGKLLPSFKLFAFQKATSFLTLACLRLLFIPLFLMGNLKITGYILPFQPLLANDYLYFILVCLMGISGGFIGTLCLMWAPARVKTRDRAKVATLMIFVLATGLIIGSYMSLLLKYLILQNSRYNGLE